MVEGSVIIVAVVIAVTQLVKILVPKVVDAWIIAVAILVGIVIALIDTHIGVVDITVAQGVIIGLGAVGVHTVATKVGGSSE